jgi:hypothetical protein
LAAANDAIFRGIAGASGNGVGQNAALHIDALLRIRHYAALQIGSIDNADW